MPRRRRSKCSTPRCRNSGPYSRDLGLCRSCGRKRRWAGGRAGGRASGRARARACPPAHPPARAPAPSHRQLGGGLALEDGFSQIFQHLDAAIAGGPLHGYEALYALHVVLQAQLKLIDEVHKRFPSTERLWEVVGEGNGKKKRKGDVVRQKAKARNMLKARARASPSASPRGVGSPRKSKPKVKAAGPPCLTMPGDRHCDPVLRVCSVDLVASRAAGPLCLATVIAILSWRQSSGRSFSVDMSCTDSASNSFRSISGRARTYSSIAQCTSSSEVRDGDGRISPVNGLVF